MCSSMGSYFHNWIDYNGVAFSIVTRMGLHIPGIFFFLGGGKNILASRDLGYYKNGSKVCVLNVHSV